MESCDCIDMQWPHEELLVRYQYISDVLIAFAYFSIPIELIYFVQKSAFFPYRWVLMQFGAFIVLCGATHFINLWTFSMHSKAVAVVMTVAKIACAIVSCATALMLVHIIPDLLSVKTRELFLKNKAEELDREMGLILTQEETGRHVRMQCVYHITAHWLGSGPFLVGTCHPRLLLFVYLFYICQISKLMIGLNSLQKAMLSWF